MTKSKKSKIGTLPEFINRADTARLLGVTAGTVTTLGAKGLPSSGRGRYDPSSVVGWYLLYKVRDGRSKPRKSKAEGDVDTRLTIARAEKIERENDIASKNLISKERYHGFVGYIGTIVANAFESLGARLCNQIAALDDPAEIQKLIWVESRDTRTQIATKAEEMELDLVQELTVDP